jgi:hypothetical protein
MKYQVRTVERMAYVLFNPWMYHFAVESITKDLLQASASYSVQSKETDPILFTIPKSILPRIYVEVLFIRLDIQFQVAVFWGLLFI